MNSYTLEQLADPATYQTDPELAKFAAEWVKSSMPVVNTEHPHLGLVEAIALAHNGGLAPRIHKSLTKRLAGIAEAAQQRNSETAAAERALAGITYPAGVAARIEGGQIILTIPRDGGLMTPRVKRLGGWWDVDRSYFRLPLSAAPSLPRVLANWDKAHRAQTEERARQERERQAQREAAEAKRAAAAAQREREWAAKYAAAEAQRAQRRANRAKVVAGQYQIGDDYHGHKIESFGQTWTATEWSVPDKYWHGSLYEPCPICGQEPVDVNEGVCERHHSRAVQVATEYCYAYYAA